MVTVRVFATMDLYLAAFLSLNNIEPTIEVSGGKAVFRFNPSDELYRVMNLYNANHNVPAADFVTKIKALRGQMLSVREGMRGYEKGNSYGYSQNK